MTTSKRERDALCATFVRTATQTGTYSNGNHLNLRVDESGGKRRLQRVTINGKRKNMGLGKLPSVSLAEARKAACANVMMIREGRDSISEWREEKPARQRPPTPTLSKAYGNQPCASPDNTAW